MPEKHSIRGLTEWKNGTNGFKVFRLHYSADPHKDPQTDEGKQWIEQARRGMPSYGWEREYEISFAVSAGKRVHSGFKEAIHVDDLSYKPGLVVFRGWDFGYHHPAVLFSQVDATDRWLWLHELLGNDIGLRQFARKVVSVGNRLFPDAEYIDYCDPAGVAVHDKDEGTSVDILRDMGIHPRFKKSPFSEGRELIDEKLETLGKDGKPQLLLNKEGCPHCFEGFLGGYCFNEKGDTERPDKNSIYIHLFDAARYTAVNLFTVRQKVQKIKQPRFFNKRILGRRFGGAKVRVNPMGY
jgi:hypothetical protein